MHRQRPDSHRAIQGWFCPQLLGGSMSVCVDGTQIHTNLQLARGASVCVWMACPALHERLAAHSGGQCTALRVKMATTTGSKQADISVGRGA